MKEKDFEGLSMVRKIQVKEEEEEEEVFLYLREKFKKYIQILIIICSASLF